MLGAMQVAPRDLAKELATTPARAAREAYQRELVDYLFGRARSLADLKEFLGGVSRQAVFDRLSQLEAAGWRVWSPSTKRPRLYFIPDNAARSPQGV